MKLVKSRRFQKEFAVLPEHIKRRVGKQLALFLQNPENPHPSLHIKKMQGYRNLWEGRITKKYRFIFQKSGNIYTILRIGSHDILGNP